MDQKPVIGSLTVAESVEADPALAPRPLLHSFKVWFLVDLVVLAAAELQLYVFSGDTERFFAWTIGVPLTAAFLGAGYWSAMPLVYYASRQPLWAHARLAVFGVFTFVVMSLAVTLLHLDKFHLSAGTANAQVAAWLWMAIYVSVPILLLILTVLQLRVPGTEPASLAPLPLDQSGLRGAGPGAAGVGRGAFGGTHGFLLAMAADSIDRPSDRRLALRARRRRRAIRMGERLRPGARSSHFIRVGGVLQLLAVARFSNTLQWGEPTR